MKPVNVQDLSTPTVRELEQLDRQLSFVPIIPRDSTIMVPEHSATLSQDEIAEFNQNGS